MIRWKDDQPFTLFLRDGSPIYCRMMSKLHVAFYLPTQEIPKFLFCSVILAKNVFKYSKVQKDCPEKLPPAPPTPTRWLTSDSLGRTEVLWKNTPMEISINLPGKSKHLLLLERDRTLTTFSQKEICKIDKEKWADYCQYEDIAMQSWPFLNERLLLCKEAKKVVHPDLELILGFDPNPSYMSYYKMMAGIGSPSDYGYQNFSK
ncbi:MAG: hypothetical protein IPN71_10565 [Fibrobacteres bacterium]|nr:hypothetical protein [Fibrobacterota bacterium]